MTPKRDLQLAHNRVRFRAIVPYQSQEIRQMMWGKMWGSCCGRLETYKEFNVI